ncbi:MAG: bifunctional phosphoribosyl-AMP cyclohydrolase/phosphoribosyl-ATP diphosphatase HisIE, partial [Clostridiales bacterium]|nr:bifunctional phosphoribosyl-AMP cyclohydrolase/phosphoribosyl-ATP diphosphatase HisIE [Clostridiales bacterium]
MAVIDRLKFDSDGLIPAIVTDYSTGAVLMMAYMNLESLEMTLREGRTCFWSRSRQELWRKGETSGNVQHVVSIKADCDLDTLLISVKKEGPACHTGEESCFFETIFDPKPQSRFSVDALYELLKGRKENPKEGSYTSYLFEKGLDKILKKIGEESTEVIISAKAGDKKETIYDIADLCYHVLTLMAE